MWSPLEKSSGQCSPKKTGLNKTILGLSMGIPPQLRTFNPQVCCGSAQLIRVDLGGVRIHMSRFRGSTALVLNTCSKYWLYTTVHPVNL